jgi:hypothetical protein
MGMELASGVGELVAAGLGESVGDGTGEAGAVLDATREGVTVA